MKPYSLKLMLIALILGCISCKRTNDAQKIDQSTKVTDNKQINNSEGLRNEDAVRYYSEKFLKDSTFAQYFYYAMNRSLDVQKAVRDATGSDDAYKEFVAQVQGTTTSDELQSLYESYSLNTSELLDYKAEILTAQVLLYEKYKDFFELDPEDQNEIFTNIVSKFSDFDFMNNNRDLLLVQYANEILEKASNIIGVYAKIDITWAEIGACAVGALSGYVQELSSVTGQVFNLISQGSQYLTWGGVFSIARKVIGNYFPWYKALSIGLSFGACLWAAA